MATSPIQNLDDDQATGEWLESLGVEQAKRATVNLLQIANQIPPHYQREMFSRLNRLLPQLSDPDRALNNLERLAANSGMLESLIGRNDQAFADLMMLFSTSQYLSDLLVRDSTGDRRATAKESGREALESDIGIDWLTIWKTRGQLLLRENLIESLMADVAHADSINKALRALRRFKHVQTLRIGVGDLIVGHRVPQVTSQISFVASAIVEAAYRWSRRSLVAKHGQPVNSRGQPSKFVVLALGKLGGTELNYSSDIDLVMVFDEPGMTSGVDAGGSVTPNPITQKISNQEFYERLCRQMVKLIGEPTELGATYRVDLRLRPNGASGKICGCYSSMIRYYDLQGRTWERQALIKATPVAGDMSLGHQLLNQLTPWIYHRNLSRADIGGIKALKRKIERRALASGEDKTNVKTGRGGIRDVEFIIQFMQLLNGGDLPEIRTANTLEAVLQLERAKCLSPAESTVLSKNYIWLRKLEHRLQMMFDLQTHSIPSEEAEQSKLAKRMGFADLPNSSALEQFQHALNEATESNRKILNHLLHGAFGMAFGSMRDTGGTEYRLDRQAVPLEVDLVLDPNPDQRMKEDVLQKYGFQDINSAYNHLMDLAKEPTQFLSSRRCKHFLASVAPALLSELAQTPDPDASLVALTTVSDCLGAKGVLWELFSFNPPTLSLYVRLCASSDYLVGILRSNPGMIDDLVDALQLGGLPSYDWLKSSMDELTKGATDLTPILHSFKNTQHMRVGIRDILGRDDVRDTHRTLSDVAEICLITATRHQYAKLLVKYGDPGQIESLSQIPCPMVILGLGKLGGREPNYHSDLDVIFLFDADIVLDQNGNSRSFDDFLNAGITSQFFFSELAAAITQFVAHSPRQGRLYEIDSRLRPTGKSGSLAVSMDEFERYFASGQGHLWERQALCKARPVFGSEPNASRAMELVCDAITALRWRPEMAKEIHAMRIAIQKDCSPRNLKRGEGGTVDVEFAIQMLQLKHAVIDLSVLVPGTREAIEKLVSKGYLDSVDAQRLADGYQLLRSVEARLRLMNTSARHDLPDNEKQLAKLAFLLNYPNAKQLSESVRHHRASIREVFNSLI